MTGTYSNKSKEEWDEDQGSFDPYALARSRQQARVASVNQSPVIKETFLQKTADGSSSNAPFSNQIGGGVAQLAAQKVAEEGAQKVGEKVLEKGGEQVLGKVAGAAGTALAAKGMYDMATTGEGATGDTTTDVASSAMSGAMSGAAFGAPGMAVGAVLGGIAGGLGSNAARKNQNAKIEGEKFEKQALIAEKKMARNSKIFGDMKADFEKALRTPRRTM